MSVPRLSASDGNGVAPRVLSPLRELPAAEARRGEGAEIAGVAGVVLSLVAVAHVALIWIPAHLGAVPWEFAAATQTVDVFPLAVTGAALAGWSVAQRGWRGRALALAVWCALAAAFLAGILVLLLLDLPVAWRSVGPEMRESLLKTGGKAGALGLLFTAFHLWLMVKMIRARRR